MTKDVKNVEGLRWLAEVQQSDAAKWAVEEIERLQKIERRWENHSCQSEGFFDEID